MVGVHEEPVAVEFVNVLSNEITIVKSMGYPDKIFEVTKDLVANWQKYALIVSHTVPFDKVSEALQLAGTPAPQTKWWSPGEVVSPGCRRRSRGRTVHRRT